MGIRIAQLESECIWVVYQSVTEKCFPAMIRDELAAEIYAHGLSSPARDVDADDCLRFVRKMFGDEPTEHEDYFDVLREVQGRYTSAKAIAHLWETFQGWLRHQETTPVYVPVEDEE